MSNLVDAYVFEALRSLGADERDEAERELRSSIGDEVDGRTEAGEAPEAAEVATLEQLGDPAVLAAGLANKPLHLIGPELFLIWRRVLSTLLVTVVPTIVILVGLLNVLDQQSLSGLWSALGLGFQVALHLCFWVTLVFALLERAKDPSVTGALKPEAWTVADLDLSDRSARVSWREAIGRVFSGLFGASAYIFVATVPLVYFGQPDAVPFFNPELLPGWLLVPVIAELLLAATGVVLMGRRSLTWSTVILRAVLTTVSAGTALWLLWTNQLLNPAVGIEAADGFVLAGLVILVLAVGVDLVKDAKRLRVATIR